MDEKGDYLYNLGLAFYEIAARNAAQTAFAYTDKRKYSYGDVNLLSNRIARLLIKKNILKGDVVAIFNDKSLQGYCLMLACLKIGAVYTNLDDSSPWERIRKILETSGPKAIFYGDINLKISDHLHRSSSGIEVHHVHSQPVVDLINAMDDSDLPETAQIHGGQPAYIMFTSGSTGFPKGAVMSHNNVLNFIQWGQKTFSVTEQDIFTNVNPIYFDNSVFDFYTCLFSGATLVPVDNVVVKNAKLLVDAINKTKCTIWFSVPSLLVYLLTTKALSKDDFPSIKRIAFGGEGFPKNKLKQLFDLFGDRITLFNVYGPTECTCICSSYIISGKDFDDMSELAPLGYIAPNFGYEIIPVTEDNLNYGELALTGPCVGLGYYNDVERTRISFVENPGKRYVERMYKTGDIVERAKSGYLYFRGRVDNQIKHMGYRIELEEIEAAFSSLEYINEVGVVYEKITPELGQIKAYISVADKNKESKEILDVIKTILPPYMIPKIIIVESLPKNRNGKIDRKQLAAIT